ncbi:MAG: deoxyguanosinetriphosphate triphosphohydrolase [Lachnospiraceae bacterium]|nr:deoxyguanosinetriphosphate triphosphohydrolase [Lachnospiraceae bacterium]
MTIRERTEAIEEEYLSPYASLSKNSKGRAKTEPQCDIRPVFQRDRDRILHSKAFRRLKNKTQVFLSPKGDHYRTRLSHTLEVSQNARTIAKALRLNEDLTEAIALGHDLGHTPFGHCCEGVLNELCAGGFVHSEQSVRIVEKLEKDGEGLNLTEEVIDGIRNHQSEGTPHTLEGQVVRLADKIAYVSADVDDAIRAHLISEEDIPEDIREVLGTNVKKRLNTLIHDVITESLDSPEIRMSEERLSAMFKLREFLFLSVYRNPEAKGEEVKAKRMIEELFHYFMENFEAVPEKFRRIGQSLNDPKDRVVCDYISGMTDDFATQKFAEYFIPRSWEAELD